MIDPIVEAARLKEDFQHGGKLGAKSTKRLLDLVEILAVKVTWLEERLVAQKSA